MAKSKKSDPITASVKKTAGAGTQSIVQGSDDFGARDLWGQATNPASVKAMVGKVGEFSKYKHDSA